MNAQTLSKSRFAVALECPTKVFYGLDDRYVNRKCDDEFLRALANGGFQVGALAKLMFQADDPHAVEITAVDQDSQITETTALLARDNVMIFEATIRHDNLLIRADVLVKCGTEIDLVEVKAKSWKPDEDSLIGRTAKSNPIDPDWEPYVNDMAFQQHVLELAYPKLTIHPWLMLVDKSRTNGVHRLSHFFEIVGEGRDRKVVVSPDFGLAQLTEPLLIRVDAQEAVRRARTQVRKRSGRPDLVFGSLISAVAGAIERGERLEPVLAVPCKACEFYCPPSERAETRRSGWAECMERVLASPITLPREESVFGFYGKADVSSHVAQKHLFMKDIPESDLTVRPAADKISVSERQRLQWLEIARDGTEPLVQTANVAEAIARWTFPLHFIDFETAQPALPFHAGQHPYQHILFQFSHHVVTANGAARHQSQCLLTEADRSPSIEVVRRLRDALSGDAGTVLHWYPHERTILSKVQAEIKESAPTDAAQLLKFLETMGLEKDSNLRMFDLGRLVADHVFLPATGGSSSMKRFLPAVLRNSPLIQMRYSRPVYGADEMPSLNFKDQTWVVERDGVILDPYQLLDPLFGESVLDDALLRLEASDGAVVANGAAAMIAYGQLQNPTFPEARRTALKNQLLRYCELDTLAMVLVYEALRSWVGAGTTGT